MLPSKTYRALIAIMICIGSACIACAQQVESLYINDLRPGSTVLVITNRVVQDTGTGLHFPNEIRKKPGLQLLETTFYQPDSLEVKRISAENFYTQVQSAGNDWVLFVHGDSKTFEQAVMRGFDIQHLHRVNVIVFSWPSRDPELGGVKNFKNSKEQVIESLDHFIALLDFVQSLKKSDPDYWDEHNLSCFIHSLGNYYLENIVKSNLMKRLKGVLFDNLILNAAAVNQDGHPEWLDKLHMQNRIYVISNKQDFNLKGVRIFTKDGKQLGEKVKHPLSGNATYIQFTKAVGFRFPTGTTHTYFIGQMADKSMNIRRFYTEILHGEPADLEDGSLFEKRNDGLGYDLIK